MIVGPTSIGKSTLMNEVIRLDSRFARVRSFTTRPPRENDEPGHYIYFSDEELAQNNQNDALITDTVYPTTGFHYGTVADSYNGEFNLLDTLANSVDDYRALPFKRTITISLTANPSVWQSRLKQRFPNGGDDMKKRLQEAVLSTEWSLAQTNDHHWLLNSQGDSTATAQKLIEIATGSVDSPTQPPEAAVLHQAAVHLLS